MYSLHKRHWLALQLWVKAQLKRRACSDGELGRYLNGSKETYLMDSLSLYREMGVAHKMDLIKKELDGPKLKKGRRTGLG